MSTTTTAGQAGMSTSHAESKAGASSGPPNQFLPFLNWFRGYKLSYLRSDLLAGLTVAFVLIPQSMAYAQLAGLPAYYGLYAAFLPPLIAALFGSSRQLATGPVAVVSLMTATALEPIAATGSEGYIAYAVLLALIVGLFQFALGLLRLGVVVNFLSHPVVTGFTNAAALIIATSQLSKIFGVYVDTAPHHYETVWRVLRAAVDFTHWPTVGLAVLAFVVMVGLKRISPRIPYVLIAVAITTALSMFTHYEHNVRVPLDAIQSTAVRSTVEQLDSLHLEILAASSQRAELSPSVMESKNPEASCYAKCHQPEDFQFDQFGRRVPTPNRRSRTVELNHLTSLINLKIDALKDEIHAYNRDLRSLQFVAVPQTGGSRTFYLNEQQPQGARTDGRMWRMIVKSGSLMSNEVLMQGGGAVVGTIPSGLPPFRMPKFDFGVAGHLFVMAVIISLLGFMEAISIAKAMAARTKQRLDPNQELIGQGLANILGSFGQSYPVSGSFSRSAVNIQSGALTGLSSVFTSCAVVITLLFFTPLLYHLPQSVLAAVIMMAVIGLVNLKAIAHAWQAQRHDGIIAVVTFVATLGFAPHLDRGILLGVTLTLGIALFRHMRPSIAVLSKHPDGSYRNAERWKLKQCRHIGVIRCYGSLFFASAHHMEERVLDQITQMPELRHVLIVGNAINDIDSSGVEILSDVVDRLQESGLGISISGLNDSVLDVLTHTGLVAKIGEENFYRNVATAISTIRKNANLQFCDDECPLLEVHYASEEHRHSPSHARVHRADE